MAAGTIGGAVGKDHLPGFLGAARSLAVNSYCGVPGKVGHLVVQAEEMDVTVIERVIILRSRGRPAPG